VARCRHEESEAFVQAEWETGPGDDRRCTPDPDQSGQKEKAALSRLFLPFEMQSPDLIVSRLRLVIPRLWLIVIRLRLLIVLRLPVTVRLIGIDTEFCDGALPLFFLLPQNARVNILRLLILRIVALMRVVASRTGRMKI
jgi:hypothetical protein